MAKKTSRKKTAATKKKVAARKTTASKKARTTKSAGQSKRTKRKKRRKAPSALRIQSQHVDFMTYKVDQLLKFYGEILELETETRDPEGLNHLIVTTSPSSTLGFMPPHLEMPGDRPLPREPSLYFEVKDVDRAYAQLIAKGAAFMGPPQEMPWGDRVVTTTDPEGRTIMLASKARKKKKS